MFLECGQETYQEHHEKDDTTARFLLLILRTVLRVTPRLLSFSNFMWRTNSSGESRPGVGLGSTDDPRDGWRPRERAERCRPMVILVLECSIFWCCFFIVKLQITKKYYILHNTAAYIVNEGRMGGGRGMHQQQKIVLL
eukprot:GEMP01035414.1.p1 GENE.GEMP01035414.1~~GEMP01035414.1.p1  ORF type:complete len:139 (-),score=8.61 GEMP01035414.1:255-671(-)